MSHHGLDPERLLPLQQLAHSREQESARVLAQAQATLAEREARLAQLVDYREPELGQTLAAPALLLNREAFRQRLAEAIRQQQRIVDDGRTRVEEMRQRWLDTRRELLTIDQMLQRCHERERQESERLAQRQLDELAMRSVGSFAR